MAAHPQTRLTPEEYLKLDRASTIRHEYYDGVMYAMAGGSYAHALIIGNLNRELGNALKGRCRVTPTELRLRVPKDDFYTYPDIMVVCGEPRLADHGNETLTNPVIVIEVLSPSTEAHDRGLKAMQFRRIESLQEYAFVWQSQPRIELFRRDTGGKWIFSEVAGMESACRFDSVDAAIPLSEVYFDVTFEEQPLREQPADATNGR